MRFIIDLSHPGRNPRRGPDARPEPPRPKDEPRRIPVPHTPDEAAEAAEVVGFRPGFYSQIRVSE